jgi:hypothetical protein
MTPNESDHNQGVRAGQKAVAVPDGAVAAARLTFSQKWGDDPFTQMGHTQVPNALVEYAARLNLRSEECWLVCCILRFKYSTDNPRPTQETLARLFGQSVDTVQRTVKKIVSKKLLKVERARADGGTFTHTVYDFTPLRFALNECYYQDHPQERPQTPPGAQTPAMPETTTPQKCGLDDSDHTAEMRPGSPSTPHRTSAAWTTPQKCGPNKSLLSQETEKEDSSKKRATLLAHSTASSDRPAVAVSELGSKPEIEELEALAEQLRGHGVNRATATRLAREMPDECRRQLSYLPFMTEFRSSKGAYLRAAVEQGFGPPPGWEAAEAKTQKAARAAARRQAATAQATEAEAARERLEQAKAELRGGDPERWAQIVKQAEGELPPPIRCRPDGPGYRAALEGQVGKLVASLMNQQAPPSSEGHLKEGTTR